MKEEVVIEVFISRLYQEIQSLCSADTDIHEEQKILGRIQGIADCVRYLRRLK